eukprot:2838159-Amphidinium_carterae.1
MATVQLKCRLWAAGSFTSKEQLFEVGVLGRVACDPVSYEISLGFPGSGLHFHIRGRVRGVSAMMTIPPQTFFDVHIDDQILRCENSRLETLSKKFCLLEASCLEPRDVAVDPQMVIRQASGPTGGQPCTIQFLDVQVDLGASSQPAIQIGPGVEPEEVLEVLGDSDSVGIHWCEGNDCQQRSDFRGGW